MPGPVRHGEPAAAPVSRDFATARRFTGTTRHHCGVGAAEPVREPVRELSHRVRSCHPGRHASRTPREDADVATGTRKGKQVSGDRRRPWFRLAEFVLIPLNRIATRRRWHGRENIPRVGGVLVVANHISKIDPVTFGYFVNSTGRVPKFLAKAELFDHRYLKFVFRGTDQIPVHRGGQGAAGSVQAASAAVRGRRLRGRLPRGDDHPGPGFVADGGQDRGRADRAGDRRAPSSRARSGERTASSRRTRASRNCCPARRSTRGPVPPST